MERGIELGSMDGFSYMFADTILINVAAHLGGMLLNLTRSESRECLIVFALGTIFCNISCKQAGAGLFDWMMLDCSNNIA